LAQGLSVTLFVLNSQSRCLARPRAITAMGGGISRGGRKNRVAPATEDESPCPTRAVSLSVVEVARPSALALVSGLVRRNTFETDREARHRAHSENALRQTAILWERAVSDTDVADGTNARSLVAARLHQSVEGMLPFLDEECRNQLEAWAARPILGTSSRESSFLCGRVIGEAVRATKRAESMNATLGKMSDREGAAELMCSVGPQLAAVKAHEPPSPRDRVEIPGPLQQPVQVMASFAIGSTAEQPRRPKPNPEDYRLRGLRNDRYVRSAGDVGGLDFAIEECEDCCIFILDVASQVFIDKCSRCQILLGAVEGSVFVRECLECVFRVACGQLRTRDCERCDFLLWIPVHPIIETSIDIRFGPFGGLLDGGGVYRGQLSHLKQVGLADINGDPWAHVADFSPEWRWKEIHSSVLLDAEISEVLSAFPPAVVEHDKPHAARVDVTEGGATAQQGAAVALTGQDMVLAVASPGASATAALPALSAVTPPKGRVRLEPIGTAGSPQIETLSPNAPHGKSSRPRKKSSRPKAQAADGASGALQHLLKRLRLSLDEAVDHRGALGRGSPVEVVTPHLKRMSAKLEHGYPKHCLALLAEGFVERARSESCLAAAASPFVRAFRPMTYRSVLSQVVKCEQQAQCSSRSYTLGALAPIVSEERLEELLMADILRLGRSLVADIHTDAAARLSALAASGGTSGNAGCYFEEDPEHPPDADSVLRALMGSIADIALCSENNVMEAQSSLPCFFSGRAAAERRDPRLAKQVFCEARQRVLEIYSRRKLTCEDANELTKELNSQAHTSKKDDITCNEVLQYGNYSAARCALMRSNCGEKFATHLSADTFLSLAQGPDLCVRNDSVLAYIFRRANLHDSYLHLCLYDRLGRGYLREVDLEDFVAEFTLASSALRDATENEFLPFYVLHVTRRLLFFLDERKRGRIALKCLVCSPLLSELQEMRSVDPVPVTRLESNGFSVQSALRMYRSYVQLDVDGDGLLSSAELGRIDSFMFSPLFVSRLFQEVLTYDGLLDFKGYLDLILACDNVKTASAIRYFWRVFDIEKCGFVTAASLRPFAAAVLQTLQDNQVPGGYEFLDPSVVVQELLDMVGCQCGSNGELPVVRLGDLLLSPTGGTFAHVLVDALAFWRYDNRESLMHSDT